MTYMTIQRQSSMVEPRVKQMAGNMLCACKPVTLYISYFYTIIRLTMNFFFSKECQENTEYVLYTKQCYSHILSPLIMAANSPCLSLSVFIHTYTPLLINNVQTINSSGSHNNFLMIPDLFRFFSSIHILSLVFIISFIINFPVLYISVSLCYLNCKYQGLYFGLFTPALWTVTFSIPS